MSYFLGPCPHPSPCPAPPHMYRPAPTTHPATLTWRAPSLPRSRASAPGILWSYTQKGPRKIQSTWEPTGTEVTTQRSGQTPRILLGLSMAGVGGRGVVSRQNNRENQPSPADDLMGVCLQAHWFNHWLADYSQHPYYPGSISI